jgi:hypothetical protein
LAVLVALGVALVPAAAPDKKPPRIVAAAMVDLNRNARSDRMRLTYSERIRHARDNDGKYSFSVAGYRIRAVGTASGRTLVILLKEKARADSTARPAVRYRRTRSKPVLDRAGNQASGQLFRATRAHRHLPSTLPPSAPAPSPAPTPAPTPTPPPPPTPSSPKDSDKDGFDDTHDCAPTNASIHPGATDLPDLGFVDSNCDGIDGTETGAVFASPNGNDANPGTKSQPKRQIQAAVLEAVNTGKDVFAAAGAYAHVNAETGVAVYGGYDPKTWRRRADLTTTITGAPEGALLDGDKNVLLQLLTVAGSVGPGSLSVYGIRAVNGSALTLQRATVTAANAQAGLPGTGGATGAAGGPGQDGNPGKCDVSIASGSVAGGSSPAGRLGGNGGRGGTTDVFAGKSDGGTGGPSSDGTPGGAGGKNGDPGKPGQTGQPGANGASGSAGAGGVTPTTFGAAWSGRNGLGGTAGQPGHGGGGGGGGGGQDGLFVSNGAGNGGGGGGGGAAGGGGGLGGTWGGGSFGVYLHDSTLTVSDSSSVKAGNGGAGGPGGAGGLGGLPGPGGLGGTTCTSEVGAGGNGGNGGLGGHGGGGGGGSGGPSAGIFKAGTATATVTGSTISSGASGAGGIGGGAAPFKGGDGQAGTAASVYPA